MCQDAEVTASEKQGSCFMGTRAIVPIRSLKECNSFPCVQVSCCRNMEGCQERFSMSNMCVPQSGHPVALFLFPDNSTILLLPAWGDRLFKQSPLQAEDGVKAYVGIFHQPELEAMSLLVPLSVSAQGPPSSGRLQLSYFLQIALWLPVSLVIYFSTKALFKRHFEILKD